MGEAAIGMAGTCIVDGCAKVTRGRRVCAMHTKRMERYGSYTPPLARPVPLSDEWFAVQRYRVEDRGHFTPCWIWTRAIDRKGYGFLGAKGRSVRAHRAYYEKYRGPIPTGLVLDHLEPVTQAVNSQRGHKAVLGPDDVVAIRTSSESGAALARRYGVHTSTISRVRSGLRWGAR